MKKENDMLYPLLSSSMYIFNKSFKLTNIANYDNIDNITITLIFEQEAYDIDDDIWKNNES